MPRQRVRLDVDDLPLLNSSTGEKMDQAFKKRLLVVEWLNFELKKAFIEMQRQLPAARYYSLKHFATAIRTAPKKQDCEYWIRDLDPEDLYCEYVAQRDQRLAR